MDMDILGIMELLMANKKAFSLLPRPCMTCKELFVAKYAIYCSSKCRIETNPWFRHGHAKRKQRSVEYNIYERMKSRCSNKKSKDYVHYGGRGISVCSRWLESFENFFEDMGARPSEKHSIDRINNNGNYEPSNCRWTTQNIQVQNSRRTTNESGYRGVSKRFFKGKWFGNYQVVLGSKYLGFTNNLVEAAKMYDRASIKKYGIEGYLNFPELIGTYLEESK